jgi:hypothetical protein
MSTVKWTDPNNPENEYDIGTEGWEFNDSGRPYNILDYTRDYTLAAIHKFFPGLGFIPSVIAGVIAGDDAWCPTYGLWAGPGWAGKN